MTAKKKQRLCTISVLVTPMLKVHLQKEAAKAKKSISLFLAEMLKNKYKIDDSEQEVRYSPLKQRNEFNRIPKS